IGNIAIVLGSLVFVLDDQRNRRTGGLALEHAGQDLYGVGLAALRGEARLAGLAAVEAVLQILGRERNARRDAIDDAADRRPVAFAPGGEAEKFSKTVACHWPGALRVERASGLRREVLQQLGK